MGVFQLAVLKLIGLEITKEETAGLNKRLFCVKEMDGFVAPIWTI
jgi:hypothetical protein